MKVLTAEERQTGLGATDVAAIVGVSRYRTPIDVYREKRGEQEPQEQTFRMRMGQLLEDAIAQAYTETTGRKLARIGVVYHHQYPFLYAHPDRRIVGHPGLVEIKVASHRRDYEDGVPPQVTVQCNWQMALTSRLFVDVAVIAGTPSGIEVIRVDRDQELIDELIDEALRFWADIKAGNPPPVDASEAYRHYLTSKRREAEIELVATPEQQLLLDEWHRATVIEREATAHVKLLKNKVRDAMGDATRLIAANAVVTWRTDAPRAPWKEIAESLAERAGVDIEEEAARAKAVLTGDQVLRVTWKGPAE